MSEVEVTYLVDGTVCVETVDIPEGTRVNARVRTPDGSGYVKVPGDVRLYGRIERIRITGEIEGVS